MKFIEWIFFCEGSVVWVYFCLYVEYCFEFMVVFCIWMVLCYMFLLCVMLCYIWEVWEGFLV